MPAPTRPTRTTTLEAEPVATAGDGTRTDATLHAHMLENNPRADAVSAHGAITRAMARGVPLERALAMFTTPTV